MENALFGLNAKKKAFLKKVSKSVLFFAGI